MSTHTLESMRKIALDIGRTQRKLADLGAEMKNHPKRPKAGERPHKDWLGILHDMSAEKEDLVLELNDLQEDLAEAKAYLPTQPVSLNSLQSIIDQLVQIEASFTTRDATEGWNALTAFIDRLERDEARIQELREPTPEPDATRYEADADNWRKGEQS